MSGRKVIPITSDPVAQQITQLRGLLAMVEEASKSGRMPTSGEALRRAGFVTAPKPPPDRFMGRRILAWIEAREARRAARKRGR